MGVIQHHAIVVVGSTHDDRLAKARELAVGFGNVAVTEIVEARTNSYASFMVGPDGSKEGWGTSNAGDEARDRLISYLRTQEAGWLDYIEVMFDHECGENRITRSHYDEEEVD